MSLSVTLWILGGYLLISLVLTPVQYPYIQSLKEMDKERQRQGKTQNEMYEDMSFEEQQLHLNAQGNPFFILANLFATLLYHWKNKQTPGLTK
ncbi:DUF3949 domain-containing protein [Neobacillus muris]|uniref:DUF3949 domain-containing protein n=1 Tax=Neobacillus muris TaxID=2941334 RepID=UPI00203DEDDC|nr:DUF3949 domain-containing protein [Neobacillus muris]